MNQWQQPHWLSDPPTEFAILLCTDGSIPERLIHRVKTTLGEKAIAVNAGEYRLGLQPLQAWQLWRRLAIEASQYQSDVIIIPQMARTKKLLLCDMDSTMVASETLDDMAREMGMGEQVSTITSRAMAGEIGFDQALIERVRLLKGSPAKVLDTVTEKLRINAGAYPLIAQAKERKIRTLLVSGGFEPVVQVVAKKLGFDHYICNQLELAQGNLTGKVLMPIVDADTKCKVLYNACKELNITTHEACAIGDGANDIPMLAAAGLGIAYRGKSIVRQTIPCQFNFCHLDAVLNILQ